MQRKRHGLAPTPGTEKEWPAKAVAVIGQLGANTLGLTLAELPTHIPPPTDGPSGSW